MQLFSKFKKLFWEGFSIRNWTPTLSRIVSRILFKLWSELELRVCPLEYTIAILKWVTGEVSTNPPETAAVIPISTDFRREQEQERFPGLSQTWIHRINIIKVTVTLYVIICQAVLQSQVLPYVRASTVCYSLEGCWRLLSRRYFISLVTSLRQAGTFHAVSINKWFQTKRTMVNLGKN